MLRKGVRNKTKVIRNRPKVIRSAQNLWRITLPE